MFWVAGGEAVKKYLVTGGGGYVGRHIVERLRCMGKDVVAIGRPEAGGVDILDGAPARLERLGSPDVCVHAAWQDGFDHNNGSHLARLTAQNFVVNMLRGGCRHFVGIGSMHEVGNWVGPVDETTPTNPTTAYGISKDHLRRV